MNAFWSAFIGMISIGSIMAFLWLLIAHMHGEPDHGEDHVWDEDLREMNHPMPRWWFGMFILSILFAIVYLQLYPGLGNFEGSLNWSQSQQLKERLAAVQQQRNATYQAFAGQSIEALVHDADAQQLGAKLFAANCAGCHGQDASGALGFPNLRDGDWLYGGDAQTLLKTIADGRHGVMPPFGSALDDARIALLAETVQRWSPAPDGTARQAEGRQLFAQNCAACHGADAGGNPALGAPKLSDAVWLYGGSAEQIATTIRGGRQGNMPAHRELLAGEEIRLLVAYLLGLQSEP